MVTSNLQLNEKVLQRGKIHWFVFLPGGLFMLLSFYFLSFGETVIWIIGLLMFLLGIAKVIEALILIVSTELALTNKRTIVKTGWISRKVIELNHNKVESINFDQGVLGRIFGFGTVIICGTGGGKNEVSNIIDPLSFKNNALKIIDTYSNENSNS